MQIIGEIVFHKKFGEGEILDKLDRIMIIHFPAGKKKFYFPDAFEKHLVLKNKRKQRQVDELVGDLISERKACENAKIEEQKRQERIKSLKVMPDSQAAFGFVKNSKEEVFTSWKLTTGTYLSGNLKGTPRIPRQMQLNSACLLTECPGDLTEKERKIIGIFMVRDDFEGNLCRDGIIHSHERYRIKLEESEKLFFWDYFSLDVKNSKWGNVEIRYFSNKTMLKILRDLQKKITVPERKKLINEFCHYYLRVNKLEQKERERIAYEIEQQYLELDTIFELL